MATKKTTKKPAPKASKAKGAKSAPAKKAKAASDKPKKLSALDAADIASRDERALCTLLARLTERARHKDLDRATLTAARDLAKAVYPYRA